MGREVNEKDDSVKSRLWEKDFEFLRLAASGLFDTTDRAEALLELVDTTLGVDKGVLTCEEGV